MIKLLINMIKSYNIHEDIIIFNYNFNKSLDKYNDIIKIAKKQYFQIISIIKYVLK